MAAGVPIIAYQKGGALETVTDNPNQPERSTGIFFKEQTGESLEDALKRFNTIKDRFDPEWIRKHAGIKVV